MNWATVLVLAAVIAVFAAILIAAIRNRRRGRTSCACGASCSACPMGGKCHPNR